MVLLIIVTSSGNLKGCEMKLKSCDNCGVVLDLDKINFPALYTKEGCIVGEAVWVGDEYKSATSCPVCQERIIND